MVHKTLNIHLSQPSHYPTSNRGFTPAVPPLGVTPKPIDPEKARGAMMNSQSSISMQEVSGSTTTASMGASRKQKRRRARSSSVFTATSNDSTTRADEELATAKAAAIRLLDHTSAQQPPEEPAQQPKPPKRIRFNEITTILEEETSPVKPTDHSACTTSCRLIGASHLSHTQNPSLQTASSCTLPVPSQSESGPTNSALKQDTFQVSREETFEDKAVVNAFQAAMNEFMFHCCGKADSTAAPIRLPQSRPEERRVAALYYGKPPPRSKAKSNKPPPHTIFLPRLVVAPTDPSEEEGDDSQKVARSARKASPVISDLDMDDYWDMVEEGSD
ncbi:hypothetical protein VP01_3061g2 [Puccinia sorghi]|uniref:Uncharacterized protein n=1 Tax=Puccinia sorghi TaxID=27349 RepID=A0A0L6V0M5_9BASI|nr:hypothetical protein VP01_3061g2 [Puccinia sorghi]